MFTTDHSKEAVQEKITSSVDTAIENGYSLKFSTHLDWFMVNYEIICVLRDEMGCKGWHDLSEVELSNCFKTISSGEKLPDWNIEEEKFN